VSERERKTKGRISQIHKTSLSMSLKVFFIFPNNSDSVSLARSARSFLCIFMLLAIASRYGDSRAKEREKRAENFMQCSRSHTALVALLCLEREEKKMYTAKAES
jgi:hypothetical protein